MSVPKRVLLPLFLCLASLAPCALAADPGIPTDEGDAPEAPAQPVQIYSGLNPQTRQITL